MQWAFLCLNAASFKLKAMIKFLGLLLCCGGLLLCCSGCVLLYLTHANQTVLKQAVAKKYRWVGLTGLVLALVLLLSVLPKLVAVLMWLLIPLVLWSALPFLPLLHGALTHEVATRSKDTT
ncbi:hypothetical protein TQH59_03520 [Acinetobacter johnsonii]|uniref:Uncharacterized protein n=2 Tax=Acinetobacter johnsonii TaxID=40214 RepID=A0AA42MRD0_ACIJO|nr:hypothetical protein [Acinetobacter johnsonii]MDH0968400.1 hypothetical protein [Acinetobacter johnsonii]WQN48058.1 hypothetical protein TQH59_03520 [Acinetobacter johnsonii]